MSVFVYTERLYTNTGLTDARSLQTAQIGAHFDSRLREFHMFHKLESVLKKNEQNES